ncbi:polymer-forming cytoskeletal protein [Chloroflexota bacterium]
MFKRNTIQESNPTIQAVERVTSILGAGIIWQGVISGSGGVRIDGIFEGELKLTGMLVIGESGRVTCEDIQAETVVVAGSVKGNITAKKVEIRSTGRIWGDVVTVSFATEEGSFLRGQIRVEEKMDPPPPEEPNSSK